MASSRRNFILYALRSMPCATSSEFHTTRGARDENRTVSIKRDTFCFAKCTSLGSCEQAPVALTLVSEPIFYLLANKKERFVPSPLCQKERNLNRIVFDLGFFWRRGRDSNPRGFWPNGFQDRLVMTASIPLHID